MGIFRVIYSRGSVPTCITLQKPHRGAWQSPSTPIIMRSNPITDTSVPATRLRAGLSACPSLAIRPSKLRRATRMTVSGQNRPTKHASLKVLPRRKRGRDMGRKVDVLQKTQNDRSIQTSTLLLATDNKYIARVVREREQ